VPRPTFDGTSATVLPDHCRHNADESFSEVVERLTETADPMEFAGSWPGLSEYVNKARTDLETVDDELFG